MPCPGGFFVCGAWSRCTTGGLQESLEFSGVDLQQLGADANGVDPTFTYPAAHGAVVDAAAFGGLGEADEFGMSTFTPI